MCFSVLILIPYTRLSLWLSSAEFRKPPPTCLVIARSRSKLKFSLFVLTPYSYIIWRELSIWIIRWSSTGLPSCTLRERWPSCWADAIATCKDGNACPPELDAEEVECPCAKGDGEDEGGTGVLVSGARKIMEALLLYQFTVSMAVLQTIHQTKNAQHQYATKQVIHFIQKPYNL